VKTQILLDRANFSPGQIHGTANPANVSKADSHGCVRLTNWDVERLALMVRKGMPVEFVEGKS
jgi:lipoprotein-anchoring transpeptidase ErfK/SrfK